MSKELDAIGMIVSHLAKDIKIKANSVKKYSQYARDPKTYCVGTYVSNSQSKRLHRTPELNHKENADLFKSLVKTGEDGIKADIYSLAVYSNTLGKFPKSLNKIIKTTQKYLVNADYDEALKYLSLVEINIVDREIDAPSSAVASAIFAPGNEIVRNKETFKAFAMLRLIPKEIVGMCSNATKPNDPDVSKNLCSLFHARTSEK